jgi:hypothetical protein
VKERWDVPSGLACFESLGGQGKGGYRSQIHATRSASLPGHNDKSDKTRYFAFTLTSTRHQQQLCRNKDTGDNSYIESNYA